jgi:formylglycine-generating enzyme
MRPRAVAFASILLAACGGRSGSAGAPATGGDGGAAGGGGSAADAGAGGDAGSGGNLIGRCPHGTRGPKLVFVESSVRWYCVDGTEVSNQQYLEFLASAPSPTGQPPECAVNGTFEPAIWPPEAVHEGDSGSLSRPVRFVDWCDARAYCEWAGKRLCGGIAGGPTPFAQYASASASEWYAACSSLGELGYPYGDAYEVGYCRGKDSWPDPIFNQPPVDIVEGYCHGPMMGLYNMSGNVAEWESSCDGTGPAAACRVRGGSYADGAAGLRCDANRKLGRSQSSAEVGFRCCVDAE